MPNRPRRDDDPWYAGGLRFECQPDCGRCCTNHDNYAYVYLDGDDLPRLATRMGLTEEDFARRYTVLDDGWVVLRMDQPACPFLDGTGCTVYEARPTQCRTFPFWSEHLVSAQAWKRVGRFCPGIGCGETHPLKVIQSLAAEREP